LQLLEKNFCTVSEGEGCENGLEAGTSVACPLVASLITLLNNDRLNAGKTPLGFFNMILYKMFQLEPQTYFNNNFLPQTNYGQDCADTPNFGFVSHPGLWSPIVGCGSPNFAAIRQFVSQLP